MGCAALDLFDVRTGVLDPWGRFGCGPSGRPFQPGDQITYYVTGLSARVRVFEAARLTTDWDPTNPNENVPYYAKKIEDVYDKFRPFLGISPEQLGLDL